MNMIIAKDFLDRKLSIGDTIVFASSLSQGLKLGTIIDIRESKYHTPEFLVKTSSRYLSILQKSANIYLVNKEEK